MTAYVRARECKEPSAPGEVPVKAFSDGGSTPPASTTNQAKNQLFLAWFYIFRNLFTLTLTLVDVLVDIFYCLWYTFLRKGGENPMARKKIERNISYDDVRRKYYVNLDFGIDPKTGKQVKRAQTFDKLTQARSALRKHEAARDNGQTVLPQELTVRQWLDTWRQMWLS